MHKLYIESYKTPIKETQEDTQRKERERKDTSSQRKIPHIHGLEERCSNSHTISPKILMASVSSQK